MLRDFTLMPYYLYFVLLFTNKRFLLRNLFSAILYLLPAWALITLVRYYAREEEVSAAGSTYNRAHSAQASTCINKAAC